MLFMNGLIQRNDTVTSYWIDICKKLDYAYQPIVNSFTGEVFGYEALLRNWQDCRFKSIFDVFDRAFDEKALYTIDLELRKKAIKKLISRDDLADKALFYNLDNRVLEMPDYSVGNTSGFLSSHGISKSNFFFEISERHEFKDYTETIRILNQYKNQGFKMAIDDYGSGYSGLQLLYHTEPDVIKMDRFIIENIHRDQKKKLFAGNIVDMAHMMGIRVIAEGIETEGELNYCREIGCDYLQGYRIARPVQDIQSLSLSYSLDKENSHYGKRKGENQSSLLKERLALVEPVTLSDDGVSMLRRFQKNAEIDLLPVVNSRNEPIGVIREKDLKQYVYSPYGISLFHNHSHSRGLESFISKIPMADVNSSLEKILDITASVNQSEGVLITGDGGYLGLLESSTIIQLIHEQKLAQARDQNPLSGLAGNYSIHKKLGNLLTESRTGKRIIYFDFNNFKPFNDI